MQKKILYVLLAIVSSESLYAQIRLPEYLCGTWKVAEKEIYEHWDKTDDNSLRGVGYRINQGAVVITEYLSIDILKGSLVYTATALGQNNNASIAFKQHKELPGLGFINPRHDFPKYITYEKIHDDEIRVTLSDGASKRRNIFFNRLPRTPEQAPDTSVTSYNNKALSQKPGADEFEMKPYILVLLSTGNSKEKDPEIVSTLFKGHVKNINRLVSDKKMVVAGPFGKNTDALRGIFILQNVQTLEEARTLMQTDPAIKAGLLKANVYNWYGSAALPLYLESTGKSIKKQH